MEEIADIHFMKNCVIFVNTFFYYFFLACLVEVYDSLNVMQTAVINGPLQHDYGPSI